MPFGQGPAWSNSLFEDAAEFGYGMVLAQSTIRSHLKETAALLLQQLQQLDKKRETPPPAFGRRFKEMAQYFPGRRPKRLPLRIPHP